MLDGLATCNHNYSHAAVHAATPVQACKQHTLCSLSLLLQEFAKSGGITNGAQWYPLYGGMQDWTYLAGGCLELTLELTDQKWRRAEDLPTLWAENKEALVELPLVAALGGEVLCRYTL